MSAFKANAFVTFLASCTQKMSAIYKSARVVRGGAGKLIHGQRNIYSAHDTLLSIRILNVPFPSVDVEMIYLSRVLCMHTALG